MSLAFLFNDHRYQCTTLATNLLPTVTLRQFVLLVLATALSLVPVLSAWDDGGGHRWTQANACKGLLVLTIVGLGVAWKQSTFRPPLLTQLGMLVWFLGGLQCVPLPPGVIEKLSPASYEAYREWLPVEIRAEVQEWPNAPGYTEASRAFPVSVAPHLTRQALSLPLIFAIGCWLASICYADSRAAWILLIVPVLAGTIFCFFGAADMIRLNRDWNVELRQRLLITPVGANGPFGPFINNNTCIGYINLCLGCVLGLIYAVWVRAKANRAAQSTRFWLSGLALLFTAVMVMGVLASSSRGGFLGMIFATIVLSAISLRRFKIGWLLLFVVIGIGSTQMLDGLGIRQEMEDRLRTLTDGTASKDPRLSKWEDGLKAAYAHLPIGSGLGTYRYAQLPHGTNAVERWAVNADGMHVEWLLEGGVWLLPLVLLGMIILLRETRLVSRSIPDLELTQARIARATTVAAIFSLASLVVTQSFDFGITHVPLILTIAILCGGISHLAQNAKPLAILHPTADENLSPKAELNQLTPEQDFTTLSNCCLAIFLIAALVCATSDLEAGGAWQKLMIQRHADRNLPIQDRTMDLDSEIQKVRNMLTSNPIDAMGHRVMATLLLDRQHRIGCESLIQSKAANEKQASDWTLPINVRRAVHMNHVSPETVMLQNQDIQQWRLARQHAASALALSPLDDATRVLLIETDFLDEGRSDVSGELLIQAAELRPRTSQIVNHLALLAKSFPGESTEKAIREIEEEYRNANIEPVIANP